MTLHSLPLYVRLSGRRVILLGDNYMAEAKRRLLERAGAVIVTDEDAEASIAINALEDPDAASERLRARGVLVNTVDRPDLCDFTLPAIIERDPVLIAVGTGGASAGLAAMLRQRLEAMLPAQLGELAKALRKAKPATRERWPDYGDRRRALGAALAEGGPLDPMREDAAESVARWVTGGDAPEPELVRFTLTSADPDDLTLRQARALAVCDRVFHRPDVPSAILDRARGDAERIACDTAPGDPGPGLSVDLSMAG